MRFRSSTSVNDALKQMTTMNSKIKPLSKNVQLIGRAFTVNCHPGGIVTCHKALKEVPKDSVLVINGFGDSSGAIWGGLMSHEAVNKGVKGVIVDGAVRDVTTINKLGLPVFAKHITPRVGKVKILGDIGKPIICGGVQVSNGDLIIGDDDGVVVVPQEIIDETLLAADKIDESEEELLTKIENGENIGTILGIL